ncbi:MAG: hypothetical protein ACREH8_18160 [Opitutaceae bacterium]
MTRRWLAAVALLWISSGSGCQSSSAPRDFTAVSARFFLEAANADGTPVMLPQSGVRLSVNAQPVITEGDIVNVELVQVDLGKCLLVQLTPSATRDFHRLSVTHQGRRLVLMIDGKALGARRIDGPITNGVVYVFVEVPELELPGFVDNLKKSSVAMQRELARKG